MCQIEIFSHMSPIKEIFITDLLFWTRDELFLLDIVKFGGLVDETKARYMRYRFF